MASKAQLGDLLVKKGLISESQLERGLIEQQKTGTKLGRVLVQLGFISETDLMNFLAESLSVPYVDIKRRPPKPEAVELVPGKVARRFQIIPLAQQGDVLAVGMVNPLDKAALQEVADLTGLAVRPVLVSERELGNALDEFYGEQTKLQKAASKAVKATGLAVEEESQDELLLGDLEGGAVVDLVEQLMLKAVRQRASDIHVEPGSDNVTIRFRIDGVLFEQARYEMSLLAPIVSRIKILARMDISEKRVPQDGSFVYKGEETQIDVRVSTYPTIYGENVVLRLLARTQGIRTLEDLGYSSDHLKNFRYMLQAPHGMILVTGPTGSGKSTTLYAALKTVGSREKNIVTIEDPVEYSIELARQAQVNVKAGLTFAVGLRSILRQDPDIILVGEIRDLETATVAVQAALTGHLVFSTLHTNSALGAVTRLVDMGVHSYLVSSSVVGVLAQRLVRVLCPHCKTRQAITMDVARELGILDDPQKYTVYAAKGCARCERTGYRGRTVICEVVSIDDELRQLITQNATEERLKRVAVESKVKLMRDDGIAKVLAGITTVEEVLRAVRLS